MSDAQTCYRGVTSPEIVYGNSASKKKNGHLLRQKVGRTFEKFLSLDMVVTINEPLDIVLLYFLITWNINLFIPCI